MLQLERYTEQEYLDATFPDGEPVVDGLLYKGQSILIVAPKKAAKTMLSMQLALTVSHGLPFLKWPVRRPARVLFIACEGTNDELQDFMRRQRNSLGIEDSADFTLVRTPYLHLNTKGGAAALYELVDGLRPDLLILDPFYRLHKGSLNDDESVADSTGVLNMLSLKFGHCTWMPHHEHRERHDSYGMAFEDGASKYAGSWVLGAWCSTMLGFKFSYKKGTAELSAHFERRPRMGDPLALTIDEDSAREKYLLFRVGLNERLISDIMTAPERLFGKSVTEAAADYGQSTETFRRAMNELQAEGHLTLLPGGPGKATMIGAKVEA